MRYRTKQKGKVDQNLICLPKEHGGTSANNFAAAAANLKLVTNDKIRWFCKHIRTYIVIYQSDTSLHYNRL